MTFKDFKLFVLNDRGEVLETCANVPFTKHYIDLLYGCGCYVEDFYYKRYTKEELFSKCR